MHPRLHAATRPDHPALVMSDDGATVTYGALEARANRVAHALRALGARTGDAVAMICGNRPEFFDLYWGSQRAGIVLVPVATHLKADEVAYIVRDSASRVLIVSDRQASTIAALRERRDAMPALAHLVSIGAAEGCDDWLALCAARPDTPIADEHVGSRMLYSSGTTGRPKGIRHTAGRGSPVQPNPAALTFGQRYGLDPDTVYLAPAPLYHSAPGGFAIAVQSTGGTVVLMPKFEPETFLDAVERHRITTVMVVPTMFIRLLKLPDADRLRRDVSSLRMVVHAAAPCPVPIKRAMIEWLGPILDEFYAGSEGNGHVGITSEEWLRKPGSVGTIKSGAIHICDDDGRELPVGETGTVFFSGGRDFAYHNDAAKTAASRNPLHPDWSTMGDVGRLDEDGFLFLSDRRDFMIISGGVNIYPQEIENLMVTHPNVADVAVVGVPDPDLGEAVRAVVQPMPGVAADDALASRLIAWCRAELSTVKCPRTIDFDPALPRTETGKLLKKQVRARYWPAA